MLIAHIFYLTLGKGSPIINRTTFVHLLRKRVSLMVTQAFNLALRRQKQQDLKEGRKGGSEGVREGGKEGGKEEERVESARYYDGKLAM